MVKEAACRKRANMSRTSISVVTNERTLNLDEANLCTIAPCFRYLRERDPPVERKLPQGGGAIYNAEGAKFTFRNKASAAFSFNRAVRALIIDARRRKELATVGREGLGGTCRGIA